MDFFSRQEEARKKTWFLVAAFVAAVLCIIASIYTVIAITVANDPALFLCVCVVVVGIIGGGTLFKMEQLRQGGRVVAEMLGGQPVSANTSEWKEKQLLNIVEEMAIASGIVMPEVYIIPENGINAFAAGWGSSDAAIGVTAGCLKYLTRDELQGVIGHEMSHVLNGDMRLNIRLMGVIFGLLVLSQIGHTILRAAGSSRNQRRSSKDSGAGFILLIALALFIIGSIGVFFGNLIQAAVCRAREYLADASAVQFTRNPAGIAGALKKIGGLRNGARVNKPEAIQASHFFFAQAVSGLLSSLFSTHPPLVKRIRAIDPTFNGVFPKVKPISDSKSMPPPQKMTLPLEQTDLTATVPSAPVTQASSLLASVGMPTTAHLDFSKKIASSIPPPLRLATMDVPGAQAIIMGLLLSREDHIRQQQLSAINSQLPSVAQRLGPLEAHLNSLNRNLYLPICSLAVQSLRNMRQADYEAFAALLKHLIEVDKNISLFEYMIQKMAQRYLASRFSANVSPPPVARSIKPMATECTVVFSALAWQSSSDKPKAEEAFKRGTNFLGIGSLQLCSPEQCSFEKLDGALNALDRLYYQGKREFLGACMAVVSADNMLSVTEVELLRAIADALSCPIPPIIPSDAS